MNHIYGWKGKIHHILDDGKYTNHENNPTASINFESEQGLSVLLRDLEPGEEITENYLTYEHIPWADEIAI